jgi:hypothetical protein
VPTGKPRAYEFATFSSANAGETICLKCDKKFNSEDKKKIRICPPCKKSVDYQGTRDCDADLPANASVIGLPKKKIQSRSREGVEKPVARAVLVKQMKKKAARKKAARKKKQQ